MHNSERVPFQRRGSMRCDCQTRSVGIFSERNNLLGGVMSRPGMPIMVMVFAVRSVLTHYTVAGVLETGSAGPNSPVGMPYSPVTIEVSSWVLQSRSCVCYSRGLARVNSRNPSRTRSQSRTDCCSCRQLQG